MRTKLFTVKCDGKFCGDSTNGLALSDDCPFWNMTSSTEDVARLRKRRSSGNTGTGSSR